MRALGLRCVVCHKTFSLEALYECEDCQGILEVYYNHDGLQGKSGITLSKTFDLMPTGRDQLISLGEGNTGLVESKNLAKRLGLQKLFLKCEFTNPSGSFKDRPVSIGISKAVEFGIRNVIVASSGNGAASVAAYAARAGLKALILVPELTADEKIMQSLAYGAKVIKVEGSYSNCFALARQISKEQDYYNLTTTFYNPYTVEGDKVVGYELFEQMNGEVPDAIYVPIGAGPLLVGTYKGYLDYRHIYPDLKLPRMAGIQAEGNNPIASAFANGNSIVRSEPHPNTIAGGIADGLVGYEKDGTYTLDITRHSQGFVLDVSDSRIMEAKRWLETDEGLFVEPSGAVGLAGLYKSLEEGRVNSEDCLVVLLTGHGLKDMKNLASKNEAHYISSRSDQLTELLSI